MLVSLAEGFSSRIMTKIMIAAALSAKMYTNGQALPLNPASNRSIAFTSSYSRSVAQNFLSMTAGIHNGSASIEERDVQFVQATYIPWSPLGVFAGLVVAYSAFTGWLCWDVWHGARVATTAIGMTKGSRLKLVAGRLADPGKVVFDLLGSRSGGEMGTEVGEMRLQLGKREDGGFGIHVWGLQ
jgi:hypothetical protein